MTGKKIALVTGANKGIGKEIARQLGISGITVLIGARDPARGEETAAELRAAGFDAYAVVLDVTNAGVIAEAAETVRREHGRLDILINNAGIVLDKGPASTIEVDTLRDTFETNVFGAFAIIRAFLPLLENSASARIVNMSSGLGSLTQNSDPGWSFAAVKPLAYNASKAALNMITVIMAAELKDKGMKVNSANPGYVATDLNGHSGLRSVQQGAAIAVHLATLPDDGPTGGFFEDEGSIPW